MQGNVGVHEHTCYEDKESIHRHISFKRFHKSVTCQHGYQWNWNQYQKHGVQVDGMYEMPHVGEFGFPEHSLQEPGKQRQKEHHVERSPFGQVSKNWLRNDS